EQRVFAQLAVFAGGWDMAAAESVCSTRAPAAMAVLDLVASLVDKSLVAVERFAGHSRYRFLEPVRQYARERLDDSGEAEAAHRRHALHYASVAEGAGLEEVKRDVVERIDG